MFCNNSFLHHPFIKYIARYGGGISSYVEKFIEPKNCSFKYLFSARTKATMTWNKLQLKVVSLSFHVKIIYIGKNVIIFMSLKNLYWSFFWGIFCSNTVLLETHCFWLLTFRKEISTINCIQPWWFFMCMQPSVPPSIAKCSFSIVISQHVRRAEKTLLLDRSFWPR